MNRPIGLVCETLTINIESRTVNQSQYQQKREISHFDPRQDGEEPRLDICIIFSTTGLIEGFGDFVENPRRLNSTLKKQNPQRGDKSVSSAAAERGFSIT